MLCKAEYLDALYTLYNVINLHHSKLVKNETDKAFVLLKQLIDVHFDNAALHLDDLQPGMWVYDSSINKYRLILYIEENKIYFSGQKLGVNFKDNKFYRFLVE